jgi:signal transduction histidine kinase/ActR/RegA family two-component response regulator
LKKPVGDLADEEEDLAAEIVSVTDALRDQSDRLRAQIDAEALRHLDRRKDEFLSTLAHELRNPLAPLKLALYMMSTASTPAEAEKAEAVAGRQVNHLTRIVDDLLDAARVAHGKIELRTARVALSTIVDATVDISQPTVEASGVQLTTSIPASPVWLDVDAIRLTQVLVNLVSNAAKFTPRGGHVWLIAEIGGDEVHPTLVKIRVRDTGIGISADLLPKVFDMFEQGNQTLERPNRGLGIGLTLARNLVHLHGGTIAAQSDGPGSGSEFVVTLPLDPETVDAGSAERDKPRPPAGPPRRILLADDDADSREILSGLLEREGHTVLHVGNGSTAVERAEAFRPDIAILDLSMPGLNGFRAARQLRSTRPAEHLYLIALSGLGQAEHKQEAAEAGFDVHLTKPVSLDELLAVLARFGASPSSPG